MPHLCSVYGQVTSISSQGAKKILGLLTKPKTHARYDTGMCLDASGLTYMNSPWKGAWLANMDRECFFFKTLSEAEAAVKKYDLKKTVQARGDFASSQASSEQASNNPRPPTAASPKPKAKEQHSPAVSASPPPPRSAAEQASRHIASHFSPAPTARPDLKNRGSPPKAQAPVQGLQSGAAANQLRKLTRPAGVGKSSSTPATLAQRAPASASMVPAIVKSPPRSKSGSPDSGITVTPLHKVSEVGGPKTDHTTQTLAPRPVSRGSHSPARSPARSPRRRGSLHEGSPEYEQYRAEILARQQNNWQPGL